MAYVPALFRKTRSVQRINSYMDTVFDEVLHTTLNPNGPGAIRIHLIPPKKEENTLNPSVAIRRTGQFCLGCDPGGDDPRDK